MKTIAYTIGIALSSVLDFTLTVFFYPTLFFSSLMFMWSLWLKEWRDSLRYRRNEVTSGSVREEDVDGNP